MTTATTVAGAILARDYPEHKCPDGSVEPHGGVRPGYHGNGEGQVLSATYLLTACGCRVTGNGTLMHPIMVEPCGDHRAAMYPTL